MRAQFYNASGAALNLQEICSGMTVSSNWQGKACYFIAPGGAASLKLQLWLGAVGLGKL